jgi:hypothetical protein
LKVTPKMQLTILVAFSLVANAANLVKDQSFEDFGNAVKNLDWRAIVPLTSGEVIRPN